MADMNSILVSGRLTRKPEQMRTKTGKQLAKFSVATTTKTAEGDKTDFTDFTIWGKLAEYAERFLDKGSPVLVMGRSSKETWKDPKTGENRSKAGHTAYMIYEPLFVKGNEQKPKAQEDNYTDEIPF